MMTKVKRYVPKDPKEIVIDKITNYKSLLEITINALYRALPRGQRNYEGNNSEIGQFAVEHFCGGNVYLLWAMSNKSRRNYHGPILRDIASLYIDNRTYDLNKNIMPKRLVEDTQKVMELLGFNEDDDDIDS